MRIPDVLRPFVSRIIASFIAALFLYFSKRIGVDLGLTTVEIDPIATFITLAVFSGVHRGVDKKVNPADTASSHLASIGKADSELAKIAADRLKNDTI